jgi:hypothetical protein
MIQDASQTWPVAPRFGTLQEYPLLAEGVACASDALEILHAHSLQQQDVVRWRRRHSVQPPASRRTGCGIIPYTDLVWVGDTGVRMNGGGVVGVCLAFSAAVAGRRIRDVPATSPCPLRSLHPLHPLLLPFRPLCLRH